MHSRCKVDNPGRSAGTWFLFDGLSRCDARRAGVVGRLGRRRQQEPVRASRHSAGAFLITPGSTLSAHSPMGCRGQPDGEPHHRCTHQRRALKVAGEAESAPCRKDRRTHRPQCGCTSLRAQQSDADARWAGRIKFKLLCIRFIRREDRHLKPEGAEASWSARPSLPLEINSIEKSSK